MSDAHYMSDPKEHPIEIPERDRDYPYLSYDPWSDENLSKVSALLIHCLIPSIKTRYIGKDMIKDASNLLVDFNNEENPILEKLINKFRLRFTDPTPQSIHPQHLITSFNAILYKYFDYEKIWWKIENMQYLKDDVVVTGDDLSDELWFVYREWYDELPHSFSYRGLDRNEILNSYYFKSFHHTNRDFHTEEVLNILHTLESTYMTEEQLAQNLYPYSGIPLDVLEYLDMATPNDYDYYNTRVRETQI